MAAQIVNPPPDFERRPGDIYLTAEQYLNLSLFAKLKRKPSLDKFPGALILRRYTEGEEIYRQGEAGWTAFYALTTEDVLALREAELETARLGVWKGADRARLAALEQEVAGLHRRLKDLQEPDAPPKLRQVGNVYLATLRISTGGVPISRTFARRVLDGPVSNPILATLYRPVDAQLGGDYESDKEPLLEGDLFGERSCLYRTPRPETVVVKRGTWYVLQFLRNILDQILKDPTYKAQFDAAARKRDLQRHIGKLSLFAYLQEGHFSQIADSLELVNYEPGQVIFDEHDRSDDVYVIRTGLVKMLKNVTSLLRGSHIRSAKSLCAAILEGEKEKAGPKGKVWQMLSEPARAAVRTGAVEEAFDVRRSPILPALNDLIKSPKLPDAKEFKEVLDSPAFRERIRDLPEKRKDWSDLELRKCNRFLLEALYPDPLGAAVRGDGLPCTLTHHSSGEFFGEQAFLTRQPRNTTAVADGHPNQYGLVELVRIPGSVFRKMAELAPPVRQVVEAEALARKKQVMERLQVPVWDDRRQVQLSENFQQLGLIQGRQLMLIDLDRCTRCDECVKACVNTHSDGRSRLFLDGPRFGQYLVPITCRSCLDQVCLIGCPVGSIRPGDDRQIVIEDWCIGCGLCGSSCPYGSIQMHDVGILPERARGWLCMPASVVQGDGWQKPGFRDHHWLTCEAPVLFDRELKEELARHLGQQSPVEIVSADQTFYFRHAFDLKGSNVAAMRFRVEIASAASSVTLWVNGMEVGPDKEPRDKKKGGKWEYLLPKLTSLGEPAPPPPRPTTPAPGSGPVMAWKSGGSAAVAKPAPTPAQPAPVRKPLRVQQLFFKGRNVLAVRVEGKLSAGETLLQLRLDEVRKPSIPQDKIAATLTQEDREDVQQKLVMERAVVCDLCSTLPTGPACVTACPHDAAMRVNARANFPSK